jgi:hypothetical protein
MIGDQVLKVNRIVVFKTAVRRIIRVQPAQHGLMTNHPIMVALQSAVIFRHRTFLSHQHYLPIPGIAG